MCEHSENKTYILQIFHEQLGVNLKENIEEFHENLLGKTIFVKTGPKLSRNLLEELNMIQSTRRLYIVIYICAVSSEGESVFTIAEER